MTKSLGTSKKRSAIRALLFLPPIARHQGIEPKIEREQRYIATIKTLTRYVDPTSQLHTHTLSKKEFDMLWCFLALVRDPGLLWTGPDRHTSKTCRKIAGMGQKIAQFLNPSWSTDLLKEYLESPRLRTHLQEELSTLTALGRYEDWHARLVRPEKS